MCERVAFFFLVGGVSPQKGVSLRVKKTEYCQYDGE